MANNGARTSDISSGLPEVQRISAISQHSRPDHINATATTSTGPTQSAVFEPEASSGSRSGSIVKTSKDELFVTNGSAAPSPAVVKRDVNPIDSGHEMAENLLEDGAANDGPGDLDIRHNQFALSPNADLRRTFYSRTFSRLGKGSLRGSIFALCASAIGSGVLSLPYVLGLCGWGLGIIFMLTGAAAAEISLRMLAHLAVAHKMPNYSSIAIKAGGQKLNLLLSIMILAFMFGSCISYQIIVTSLLQYVCVHFGADHDFIYSKQFAVYQSVPTALLLLLPLSLKRDMSAFRYVSLASIGALLFTAIVLIVELPRFFSANRDKKGVKIEFGFYDLDMFTGMSMTFFAFQCQVQLLPIYSELVNPNYRRVVKVIDRAVAVDLFFYATIAVAGYLSSFNETAKIVLERQQLTDGPDVPILIAIVLVIGSILVAFPVAYNPFRQQFTLIFLKSDSFTDKQNYIITGIFILITWAVSVVYPSIDKVLAIMGGLCAATLDYAIPTYCYVKLSEHRWTHPKNLSAIIFFGFLVLVGYGSVVLTVWEMVTGNNTFKEFAAKE